MGFLIIAEQLVFSLRAYGARLNRSVRQQMKIYWRYKDVPELAPLSPKDRRAVVRYCFYRFTFRHWQCWIALLVYCAFVEVGVVAGVLLTYGLGYSEFFHFFCVMLAVLIGAPILCSVSLEQLRPHFREYLASKHGIV